MTRTLWCAAVGAFLVLGCSSRPAAKLPPNEDVQRSLALTRFTNDDCEALHKYITDEAVLQIDSVLETEKEQTAPDAGGFSEDAGAVGPSTGGTGPSSYTTTNVQATGVDEADPVKNDGTRIFVLSGPELYALSSWPPSSLAIQSKLPLEGWPRDMFLSGNTLVIFSNVYTAVPPPPSSSGGPVPDCAAAPSGTRCAYYSANTLKVTEVDVSDLANPKVTQQLYLPGNYFGSRMIGSSIRIVLSDNFVWPDGLSLTPANAYPSDHDAWVAAIDALEDQDEALIRSWPLEKWLPVGKRILADGSTIDLSYQCSDFSKSNAPTRLGILTVATIDLSQPEALPNRSSTIAELGTIYASPSALYAASPHWWWQMEPGQQQWSYLYKFDLTDPSRAPFVAGGVIEGHVSNSYELDEKDGYLRAAVNLGTVVESPGNPSGELKESNRIEVVKEQGTQLVQVGQSADFADGEWIESARFFGDEAFVSTFQFVDPFFTFDLSDPVHPSEKGQLEVSGTSTYLHPLDATHVVAIGQGLSSDAGTVFGPGMAPVQLLLFDVSDLAKPVLTASTELGSSTAWSWALSDPHAFNWYPQQKLLALPYSDWNYYATDYWSSFVSELRVFGVDPATGFTDKGALSMADVYQAAYDSAWTYTWSPEIFRSVMADNYVYAISNAGIRVADVNALDGGIATAPFPAP